MKQEVRPMFFNGISDLCIGSWPDKTLRKNSTDILCTSYSSLLLTQVPALIHSFIPWQHGQCFKMSHGPNGRTWNEIFSQSESHQVFSHLEVSGRRDSDRQLCQCEQRVLDQAQEHYCQKLQPQRWHKCWQHHFHW